jgi:hypothetical protein
MAEAVKLNMDEINGLIGRVEYAIAHDLSVSSEDLKLLLDLLLGANARLNRQKSTIDKLRKLAGLVNPAEPGNQGKRLGARQRRNRSGFATGDTPEVEHEVEKHALQTHHKGDQCPECEKGKLNKTEPASSLRVTGQAPLKVTKHILEQLRCNTCGAYFTAELPEDVLKDGARGQQYGYSARALMAIYKNLTGVPYFRQQSLQQVLGMAVAASTIYDQCKAVADVLKPLVAYLVKLAADAPEYALDDTTNRILDQQGKEIPDRRTKKPKHRTGVYTSAVVATLEGEKPLVLFKTNIGHGGEWLDEVLQPRQTTAPPLLMSDALNRNQPTVIERYIWCKCNAHARREFHHCIDMVPQAEWVIEEYGKIWQHKTHCDEAGLDVEARQRYYHEHSLPVMESLREKCRDWIERSDEIEPNSTFGQACRYFLNHFEDLSWFCHIPGAKLDNNAVERILKLIIRIRKNSLFYRTEEGAEVGDILTTVLATAVSNNVNVFEYLVHLQQNWFDVGRNPQNWLPWNYQDALSSPADEHEATIA